MAKPKGPFVKAAGTSVPVANSRAELERMLVRYGAVGFSVTMNYERHMARVEFVIPYTTAKDAPKVPVRLEVDALAVYRKLNAGWTKTTAASPVSDYNEKTLAQAERVAWRNLILWVDAALSAATIGVQTIAEAFYAHTLVTDDTTGRTERLAEYMERTGGALAPGVRALLPSSTNHA